MTDRNAPPDWYQRRGPYIVIFCLVTSTLALLGVLVNTLVDRRQNEQRDADQAALLACVGEWANTLAGSLPPVREASVRRDEAVTFYRAKQNAERRAGDRIDALFLRALRNPADSEDEQAVVREEALKAFRAKARASEVERAAYEALGDAEAALVRVRARNPYPEAPEFACELKD